MNYLAAVQRFRQETDYANTGPTTVVGQTGNHANAVSWIADAYTEIQNRHAWRWLRRDFTISTTSTVDTYAYSAATDVDAGTAIARFKRWHINDPYNPPRIYLSSSGVGTEYWLTYLDWEDFRTIYRIGTTSDSSPSHITVDPRNNIVLGPAPNDTYVITGEFIRSAQVLAANTDTPEMPTDFHMLIVYTAMEDQGYFDSADEILGRSYRKGKRLMRQLERDQLDKFRVAGALA